MFPGLLQTGSMKLDFPNTPFLSLTCQLSHSCSCIIFGKLIVGSWLHMNIEVKYLLSDGGRDLMWQHNEWRPCGHWSCVCLSSIFLISFPSNQGSAFVFQGIRELYHLLFPAKGRVLSTSSVSPLSKMLDSIHLKISTLYCQTLLWLLILFLLFSKRVRLVSNC